MGAEIETTNAHEISGELIGDVLVKSSNLKSIKIEKDSIPLVIDEIPILSLACSVAEGTSEILDAGELRFKESDRIKTTVSELKKLGSDIEETDNGILIKLPLNNISDSLNLAYKIINNKDMKNINLIDLRIKILF